MLLHRMGLVSFRMFRKNLGNLREFFGQMVYRPRPPSRQKIARTLVDVVKKLRRKTKDREKESNKVIRNPVIAQ